MLKKKKLGRPVMDETELRSEHHRHEDGVCERRPHQYLETEPDPPQDPVSGRRDDHVHRDGTYVVHELLLMYIISHIILKSQVNGKNHIKYGYKRERARMSLKASTRAL